MTDLDLTTRTFEYVTPSGHHRSAAMDPKAYVASRLIAELTDGWLAYAKAAQLADGTTVGRLSAIRSVGAFLTEPDDRQLSLSGSHKLLLHRLHDWELHVIAQFPPPSMRAKDLGSTLRTIVGYTLAASGREDSVLRRWAESIVLDGSTPVAQPLDEFSNHERLTLRNCFRTIVRDADAVLRYGEQLLLKGRDPREYGWDQLENLVWASIYLKIDDYPERWRKSKKPGLSKRQAVADVEAATGVTVSARRIADVVAQLVFPTRKHLAALRYLIHLSTGWSPEESKNLKRPDVVFADGHVNVSTVKRRARRTMSYRLPVTVSENLGWSAGDLLARAVQSMRRAWELSPNADQFWMVTAHQLSNGLPRGRGMSLVPATFEGRDKFSSLITTNNLQVSQPYDLRRARKTVKSARAVLLGTLNGAAGDDHTVEVYRNHYLPTSTVHTVAAQTVIRAQQGVLKRSLSGPTLIDSDAAHVADDEHTGTVARVASQVRDESPGDRDLALTGCADPYAPPLAQHRGACMDAPTLCLRCPNAIIFRDHIPRLLTYKSSLLELQKALPPQQFHSAYGQQLSNVDDALSQFPPDLVNEATKHPAPVRTTMSERYTR